MTASRLTNRKFCFIFQSVESFVVELIFGIVRCRFVEAEPVYRQVFFVKVYLDGLPYKLARLCSLA